MKKIKKRKTHDSVKREIIKGKFRLVARTSNNKIISSVKWSAKSHNMLMRRYKAQKSFKKNEFNQLLFTDGKVSTIERTNFSKKTTLKKSPSLFVTEIRVGNRTVYGRAQNTNNLNSIRSTKEDSRENAISRLGGEFGGSNVSDLDEGKRILQKLEKNKKQKVHIRTGTVSYVKG